MPRTDIIKEILRTTPRASIVNRVNDRAKRFVNKLLGKDIFNLEQFKPELSELHNHYLSLFDIESEKVKCMMYDLAEEAGFFKANPKLDPVQEGKRCLFLYLLGKITKEPITKGQ